MVALQAAHHTNVPRTSFGTGSQKTDRLSQATFNELPRRFQKIARELARRGEITIESR
jgi:hypothetical protein